MQLIFILHFKNQLFVRVVELLVHVIIIKEFYSVHVIDVQAFEAPWPVIQANAIYLCSSVISVSNDQHISALYHSQVVI